jgi:hypothetical protein
VKHYAEKPLIIIGGGREAAGPDYELYIDSDSETHPLVGKALREFLPSVFEGKFDPESEPEMEWVDIPPFLFEDPPDEEFRLASWATPRWETRL